MFTRMCERPDLKCISLIDTTTKDWTGTGEVYRPITIRHRLSLSFIDTVYCDGSCRFVHIVYNSSIYVKTALNCIMCRPRLNVGVFYTLDNI